MNTLAEKKIFSSTMVKLFIFAALIFSIPIAASGKLNQYVNYQLIQMFTTIFVSILLEGFPFILLGIMVSSLIQVFVSEEFVARAIPKRGIKGILLGISMGFFFPVCDCAVIPVVRRLINKGVPVYIALTFMLCAPIINPVVLLATHYAFNTDSRMLLLRSVLGVVLAVLIAVILDYLSGRRSILKAAASHHHACGCGSCTHDHGHDHDHHHHDHKGSENRFRSVLKHAEQEFFDVGKYLIIGAFIASAAQVFLPRQLLLSTGQNQFLAILVMMVFAFVISLCSTSDSFIARTFLGQFTNSSILGFLILGPMLDLKNTFVLMGNFKKRFVVNFLFVTFIIVFLGVFTAGKILGI